MVTKFSTNLQINTYLRQWYPYKKQTKINHVVYFPTNPILKNKIEEKNKNN